MKPKKKPSNRRLIYTTLILVGLLFYCYFVEYNFAYDSIKVKVVSKTIEYGSANYDINKIVDTAGAAITEVEKPLDTKKIGTQEVVIKVDQDAIVKEIPVTIEVKDTKAPEIKVKDSEITLTEGDDFDATSNTESVEDPVDGNINYQDKTVASDASAKNYYTVDDSSVNTSVAGTYPVTVMAVDNSGNKSTTTYNVVVKEKPVVVQARVVTPVAYNNSYLGTGDKTALVSLAYSLVGSPYVSGGNTPNGFDCSGFVQYLYSRIGISVSRSARTQVYDGVAVSYDAAQPGDIISWGYGSYVTHSALYVGNGMMIHAANPSTGVIVSSVAQWLSGSGTSIVSVRRI